MPIVIWRENSVHERVERLVVDESGALLELANSATPGRTVLGAIHPYADTMFHSLQLRWLAEELRVILASGSITNARRVVVETLLAAAESTEQTRGYLLFVGD
jgi:hypothetical protein